MADSRRSRARGLLYLVSCVGSVGSDGEHRERAGDKYGLEEPQEGVRNPNAAIGAPPRPSPSRIARRHCHTHIYSSDAATTRPLPRGRSSMRSRAAVGLVRRAARPGLRRVMSKHGLHTHVNVAIRDWRCLAIAGAVPATKMAALVLWCPCSPHRRLKWRRPLLWCPLSIEERSLPSLFLVHSRLAIIGRCH